jgi:hypothetical protein
VIGGAFALSARSAYEDVKASCDTQSRTCSDDTGVDAAQSGKTSQTVANVFFGVGAVALVTGGILFLAAPTANSAPQVGLALSPTHVSLAGRF